MQKEMSLIVLYRTTLMIMKYGMPHSTQEKCLSYKNDNYKKDEKIKLNHFLYSIVMLV